MTSSGAGEATRRLRRLRGVRWQWREDAPEDAKARAGVGVIAQEVEAVFPELVITRAGHKRVRYDGLVPPLMTAAAELDRRLEALETAGTRRHATGSGGMAGRMGSVTGGSASTRLDPEALASVFPELVTRDGRGDAVVAYEGLIGHLIEAVKELDARLTRLESAADPPGR